MTRKNVPHPGYFKVSGAAVEEGDVARQAKEALAREKARLRKRAGRKTRLGEAPPEQHTRELPAEQPLTATVREELEAYGTPVEEVREAVREAATETQSRPGAVRAMAQHTVQLLRGVVDLTRGSFGLAWEAMRLARKAAALPFRVVGRMRHHDEQPA